MQILITPAVVCTYLSIYTLCLMSQLTNHPLPEKINKITQADVQDNQVHPTITSSLSQGVHYMGADS